MLQITFSMVTSGQLTDPSLNILFIKVTTIQTQSMPFDNYNEANYHKS